MWAELEEELAEEFGDIRASYDEMAKLGFIIRTLTPGKAKKPAPIKLDPKPAGRPVTYDVAIPQKVFELYSSGLTQSDTAKRCGIHREVVRKILIKLGVPSRPRGTRSK